MHLATSLRGPRLRSPQEFEAQLRQRWPFLQSVEESLRGREPLLAADVSGVGGQVVTPTSLQHVGLQITEIAKSDWTQPSVLASTVLPYLGELADLWETIFDRHRRAAEIFGAATAQPYCLLLRSFTGVTDPIQVPGARVVMYVNDAELDANFASTLMAEAAWLNPVTCLHTDDMQLLARTGASMPSFRVLTVNWRGILNAAIASSGSIVLYVDEEGPGVRFEVDCIRRHELEARTLVVYRGSAPPGFAHVGTYADVVSTLEFLDMRPDQTGPATLSPRGRRLLEDLAASATTRTAPPESLLSMRCEIVDSGTPAETDQAQAAQYYFVTQDNAAAFVNYVELLPDSFLLWNSISQDMRLRGIQPTLDDFNRLYASLRMAFACAACLGFTSSISVTVGLLCKVASMAKTSSTENSERIDLLMQALDVARRFDALTEHSEWAEKIEAYRESILEDPFL